MNLEKVIFGFFIILALTLNFGFCLGDLSDISHHPAYELFAALIVSLIATVLKFGDRTQMGAVLLATSLVADLHLIAAALAWTFAEHIFGAGMTEAMTVSVVSLASGALVANVISVILLMIETVILGR